VYNKTVNSGDLNPQAVGSDGALQLAPLVQQYRYSRYVVYVSSAFLLSSAVLLLFAAKSLSDKVTELESTSDLLKQKDIEYAIQLDELKQDGIPNQIEKLIKDVSSLDKSGLRVAAWGAYDPKLSDPNIQTDQVVKLLKSHRVENSVCVVNIAKCEIQFVIEKPNDSSVYSVVTSTAPNIGKDNAGEAFSYRTAFISSSDLGNVGTPKKRTVLLNGWTGNNGYASQWDPGTKQYRTFQVDGHPVRTGIVLVPIITTINFIVIEIPTK